VLWPLAVVAGCHGKSGNGPEGPQSASAPLEAPPPPLDTSWERDPGRLAAVGDPAPDFEGIAHTGMRVHLSSFLEKPAVVFFYGTDRSAEAASEVRGFRDAWLRILPVSGMVLGVSTDDRILHRDFATAEELPFLLVADVDRKIARAFGVPSDADHDKRVTFIVGKDGKVVHVFPEVSPDGHAAEVLAVLESLGKTPAP
jgi:peroxiredoxin Q/BCP